MSDASDNDMYGTFKGGFIKSFKATFSFSRGFNGKGGEQLEEELQADFEETVDELGNNTPHQTPLQPRDSTLSLSDILGPVEWDAPPAPDKRESKEMRATRHYTPSPPRKP